MDQLKNNALNALRDVLDELAYQRQQLSLTQDILRQSLNMNVLALSLLSRLDIDNAECHQIIDELTILNQISINNLDFFGDGKDLEKWAKCIEKI